MNPSFPTVTLTPVDPEKPLFPSNTTVLIDGHKVPKVTHVSYDIDASSPFTKVTITLVANLKIES